MIRSRPPSFGIGLELADVVQERPGDRHIAVDAAEGGADRAHRLGDPETVLEQAVAVCLVVVLGRRRHPVAGPQLRVLAEHALQQDPQVRLLDRARAARAPPLPSASTPRAGPSSRSSGEKLPGTRRLETAQVDLRPEARVHGVAPAHVHRGAGTGQLLGPLQLLPDHRHDRARAIAQLQTQVLAAVAPLPALDLADQQHLVDLHAVAELVYEHELEVSPDCGRYCRRNRT